MLIQNLDDHKRKFINILSILVILSASSIILFLSPATLLRKPEVFQQSPAAGITIDVNKKVTAISPTFFGMHLMWQTHGMEGSFNNLYQHGETVKDLIGHLGLESIRFTGGSDYYWKWELGDAETPPPHNTWFSYGFRINQFIDLVQQFNLAPHFTINMAEGHLIQNVAGYPNINNSDLSTWKDWPGTVAEASELAGYLKTHLPGRTVYWELDNEPWGWGAWSLEDYVSRAKLYIQAIKAVYPTASFTWSWAVPGEPGRSGIDLPNEEQWRSFIQYIAANAPDYFDGLQFHDYYSLVTQADTFAFDALAKTRLDKLRKLLDETGKQIEIDVTEFNVWCEGRPEDKCSTVAHLLAMTQIYRQYLLHGVRFAHPHGGILETDDLQIGWRSFATINSGGGPLWARINRAPVANPLYYLQKLLAEHSGTEIIESSTQENGIDILTTKKGNTLYTLIINKNNSVKHLPINAGSGITLANPARAFVVGNGSTPHDLFDRGATQIRNAYIQVNNNTADFYAEPYSVSVVEIDYEFPKKSLYRGWCPQEGEYLVTDQKKELEDKNCEQIQEIGKVFESQIEDTYPFQRYWMKNMLEHYQTAMPADKEHISNTPTYGAQVDKVLGYVYITNKEGTIPLYQMWCGDGWLKKHFFTTNETEKNNVLDKVNFPTWQCQDAAPVGYLLP